MYVPSLERSPDIQEKIDSIRSLPISTNIEIAEKKETAKVLRMEALLANAELTYETLRIISEKPGIKINEMTDELEKRCRLVHPYSAMLFAHRIAKTKAAVSKTFSDLYTETAVEGYKGLDPAHIIFVSLLRKEVPEGVNVRDIEVKLITTYPLALGIEVEKKYFDLVDTHINVDGNFKATATLKFPSGSSEVIPIVALKEDDYNRSTKLHEEGHSVNAVYMGSLASRISKANKQGTMRTLRGSIYGNIWGGFVACEGSSRMLELVAKNRDYSGENETPEIKELEELVLSWAYSQAKDEIISDLFVDSSINNSPRKTILKQAALLTASGYDYFENGLDIKRGTPLYKRLREKYDAQIGESIKFATELMRDYQVEYSLQQRVKLLPWVLAQIPMENWKEQMEKTLFKVEYLEFGFISSDLSDLIHDMSCVVTEDELSPQDLQLHDEVSALKQDFLNDVYESAGKPLFQILNKYKEKVAEVSERVKATEAYKTQQLYGKTMNLYWDLLTDVPREGQDPTVPDSPLRFEYRLLDAADAMESQIEEFPQNARKSVEDFSIEVTRIKDEMVAAGLIKFSEE